MRAMADAVFYDETLRDLGVQDPLSGETDADKQLREASEKHERARVALREISTREWNVKPVNPTGSRRRRGKAHG